MKKKHTSRDVWQPVLAAPDRETLACMERAFEAAGVTARQGVVGSRSWAKQTASLFGGGPGVLVLAPSPKLGRDQIVLARTVVAGGGQVLAWTSPHRTVAGSSPEDGWLAVRLLEQAGAHTSHQLSTVAAAARLLSLLDGKAPVSVALKGRQSGVAGFLYESFRDMGIPVGRGRSALTLQVGASGSIAFQTVDGPPMRFEDPSALAAAIRLLMEPEASSGQGGAEIEMDGVALAMILQPPRRLLSETTSKRLLREFGMETPQEKLCRSPSEAARFTRTLEGPAVFKLVKPRFDKKAAAGAVIRNVSGDAQARRAAGELETLGSALGPPAPLGVLVSEQIPEGARISLEMRDHPRFGRLALVYGGDTLSEHPAAALSVPATQTEVRRILRLSHLADDEPLWEKLVRGLTLFTRMVHELGLQIDRAEVHPLAATPEHEEALALDALISIALEG